MSFILLTARKELRLRMRDPGAFAVWAGIPLALAGMMTLVFGGGSDEPGLHGRLLVTDHDDSFASMVVAGAFSQGPLGEIFTVEKVAEDEGRRILDDGDASGLLIIPEGFGGAVLRDEPTRLELVANPAQRILPQMLSETLDLLSQASFYFQTIGREPLRRISEEVNTRPNASDATVAEVSVIVNQTINRLDKYLNPALIDLASQEEAEAAEPAGQPNIGRLFFPSALFMTLLFMAQGLSGEIWTEREQGTLRRVASTPASLLSFVAGRTLAFSVLLGALAAIALPAGFFLVGVAAERPAVAILWVTASGCVLYLLMTLAQTYASSARTGGLITTILVFPLAMLGGAFFPFEAMPAGMAAIGRLTPNGWALELFKALLAGEAGTANLAVGFAAALALIAALVPVVVWRLRTRFVQA